MITLTPLSIQPWLNLQLTGMGIATIVLVWDLRRHPNQFEWFTSDPFWFVLEVMFWWAILIHLLVSWLMDLAVWLRYDLKGWLVRNLGKGKEEPKVS